MRHEAPLRVDDNDKPFATITFDDNSSLIEIRADSGFVLFSANLVTLGYILLWSDYPPVRQRLEEYAKCPCPAKCPCYAN